MFKVNNKSSGVIIVNFEHIQYIFLAFLLFTLNKQMLPGKCAFTTNNYKRRAIKQIISKP